MPIITFQWKDPDWYDGARWHKRKQDGTDFTDEEWKTFRKAGLGEYLVVDFDTDTGTATIRRPK